MKRLLFILVAGMTLIACTSSDKKAINSKQLQGRYDVDFSALLSDLNNEDDDELATALVAMFLSTMEMTMQFEENKLIIDASGAAINLVNAFSKDKMEMPMAVDYKIVDDSLLYTRADGEKFAEVGVIRKVDDSYDNLQLVTTEDNGSRTILKLTKKAE